MVGLLGGPWLLRHSVAFLGCVCVVLGACLRRWGRVATYVCGGGGVWWWEGAFRQCMGRSRGGTLREYSWKTGERPLRRPVRSRHLRSTAAHILSSIGLEKRLGKEATWRPKKGRIRWGLGFSERPGMSWSMLGSCWPKLGLGGFLEANPPWHLGVRSQSGLQIWAS